MNQAKSNRLLLLSCSARKIKSKSKLPALELYDGPAYRSLRRLIREHALPGSVLVRIVSAKHGVIRPDDSLAFYDHRLNPLQDKSILVKARKALTKIERESNPKRILCMLGLDYQACLPISWCNGEGPRLAFVSGPPGQRVRQMLDWLGEKDGQCY